MQQRSDLREMASALMLVAISSCAAGTSRQPHASPESSSASGTAPSRESTAASEAPASSAPTSSPESLRPPSSDDDIEGVCRLEVDFSAPAKVNLDRRGRPLPTIVRLVELTSAATLLQAQFDAVWERPANTLGDALVAMHDFTVYPSQQQTQAFPLNRRTRVVAVIAGLRDPSAEGWRAAAAVDPDRLSECISANTLLGRIVAILGPNAIDVTIAEQPHSHARSGV